MKSYLWEIGFLVLLISGFVQFSRAQEIKAARVSIALSDSLLYDICPSSFLNFTVKDSLSGKAALFVFNMTVSPVERSAFRDNETKYVLLRTKFKMNRCTLLYVDSGNHRFHTIYQKPGALVTFRAGDIYFAEITTRTTWPPLFPARMKDSAGNKIEYGPALFHFITGSQAIISWKKIKNTRIRENK